MSPARKGTADQARQLAMLHRIAHVKREVELSTLAQFAQEKNRLEAERLRLAQAARGARREALVSGQGAAAVAERFVDWVEQRDIGLSARSDALSQDIARQRAVAAQAVGRQDALEKLLARLALARRPVPPG